METIEQSVTRLRKAVGTELGVSTWECFDQTRIDAFGAASGEDLFIHCDPVRAATTLHRGTIVQASLLLARLGTWIQEVGGWIPASPMPLNYGYDRVRILTPVRVGHPVRGRFFLTALEERGSALVLLRIKALVEIKEQERPALVAHWIIAFPIADEAPA